VSVIRIWSARTTKASASKYAAHLRSHVLPDLEALDGFERILLLERELEDEVEIVVETFWRSLDDIRAFAGDDVDRAVIADEATSLLTQYDRRVRHYSIELDRA
jgi:heme-degrading monooxygenase HmoA